MISFRNQIIGLIEQGKIPVENMGMYDKDLVKLGVNEQQ
jgi:hypothetical protein